jgi:hypothetical protein
MDSKEITEKLEQERAELNALINKGITFTVSDVRYERRKGFGGLFRRRVPVTVKKEFTIEEPTLGTLDRLSAEWIEIAIDEEALKGEDGMQKARTLIHAHAHRCAKIVALAVLGSEYLIPSSGQGGTVRYKEDRARLERLTSLFVRTVKPSLLLQLCTAIMAMCNPGDFLNSIRLMSAGRTTMPNQIEENNGD